MRRTTAQRLLLVTVPTLVALLCAAASMLSAQNAPAPPSAYEPGTVAIFGVPQNDVQLNAITDRAVQALTDTFNRCGRFLPVERSRLIWALEKTAALEGEDRYRRAGDELRAELVVTVITGRSGTVFVGAARLSSRADNRPVFNSEITVASRVMLNVPIKLSRELAQIHRGVPIRTAVMEQRGEYHRIGAGQWHGLAPGHYRTDKGQSIRIVTVSRYHSLARLPQGLGTAPVITIDRSPQVGSLMAEFDAGIDTNTFGRYSIDTNLLKDQDAGKKFFEALALVNPATNIILPGYGTHLTTGHLGFKDTTASIPGAILTTSLIFTQLTLPEFMGKFKINYFPWVMDSDKTVALRDLQIFMFATLPLTISAGFLDQLAHQCHSKELVPPLFLHRNTTAFALSAMLPGGGLFYKGYRIFGWGFYFSEMFLGAFAVYNKDVRRIMLPTAISLGAVKLTELALAFFIKPNYGFYHFETARQAGQYTLSLDIRPGADGTSSLGLAATMLF